MPKTFLTRKPPRLGAKWPLGRTRAAFECGLGEKLLSFLNRGKQESDKDGDDPDVDNDKTSHKSVPPNINAAVSGRMYVRREERDVLRFRNA